MLSEHDIESMNAAKECERFEDECGEIWLVEKLDDEIYLHKLGHKDTRIHYWEGMDLLLGLHHLH